MYSNKSGSSIRHLKELIKEFIWAFSVVRKKNKKKDIILLTSRRSGSTWLAELMSVENGIRSVDQPLSARQLDQERLNYIPICENEQLIYLNEEEKNKVKEYLALISNGTVHVNEPWEFWSKRFSFIVTRHFYKITDASSLIEFFAFNTDSHLIFLTRHPIAQALSTIKRGWGLTCKAYLNNVYFVEEYLNEGTYELSRNILDQGSQIEKYALNWVLENLVALKKCTEIEHCINLSYEEIVMYPEKIIMFLTEELKLNDSDKMEKRVLRPSKTINQDTSAYRKLSDTTSSEDMHFMIKKWKEEIDDKTERKVFDILESFGVDKYEFGNYLPAEKHLNIK
jgi:hypothetical protein